MSGPRRGRAGAAPVAGIVYATHRPEPRFEWFADSLARQIEGDGRLVEVIVVDGLASPEREDGFARAVRGRFPMRVVAAKPSPWNGPYRLTGVEYSATASARNTGIACASAPYVVFQDDRSVLMPGWWAEARAAARAGIVLAATCHVHRRMVVEGGVLVRSLATLDGIDRRFRLGDDDAAVRVTGGYLGDGGFGAPRDLLVELNGFDELCDPIGIEIAQLGRRLELAGDPILYSRRMACIRSSDRFADDVVRKLDKATDRDDYLERLAEFGVTNRFFDGGWSSSDMVLDLLFGTRERGTLGNHYTLAELDEESLVATGESLPLHHWFDGQPFAEM